MKTEKARCCRYGTMGRSKKALTVATGMLLFGLLVAGCAPAYRCYSSGCVNCKYCAPPPLPFVHYPHCVCHSCVAARHLSARAQPTGLSLKSVDHSAVSDSDNGERDETADETDAESGTDPEPEIDTKIQSPRS